MEAASEARYHRIFDRAAVSIWDEDFSPVVDALDALRRQGVRDFRRYFDEHPAFVAQAARLVRIRDVNQATLDLFEARDKAELLASLSSVFLPETLTVFRDELLAIAEGATSFRGSAPAQTLTGRRLDILLSMVFPADDARLTSVLVSLLDMSDLKRAEEALRLSEARLRLSEERYRQVVDLIQEGIWMHVDGKIAFANPYALQMFGAASADELIGRSVMSIVHPEERARAAGRTQEVTQGSGSVPLAEMKLLKLDGRAMTVSQHATRFVQDGKVHVLVAGRDVTAQQEAEARLHQAQKMESVGQLTGGIAHDFNNLLTVVIGNLDALIAGVAAEQRPTAESALRAAERGAGLVRQLLAFSRRQMLRPETVALNRIAADMDDLLRRTLGEEIQIVTRLTPDLWPALADRSQLESAVLNLAINARDAMPGGGTLTIETSNVRLDDEYAARNAEVVPGDYALLAVTDTGTGMAPEVLERAVEPFFTTKELGKGSGLGLSMIFGFAKQSGGHLKLYSEPGHGTTVRLYLPRQTGEAVAEPPREERADLPAGHESVLVVEDDEDVRALTVSQLRELGYRVLEAADGPAAQTILDSEAPIDVILTDVVMPGGLTGRQLAEAAKRRRPHLKTLYTSGYTENSIIHQGKLDRGVHFLPKPFRRQDLAVKLRGAIEQPDEDS
jgi:PAS domain S-box-containing protein